MSLSLLTALETLFFLWGCPVQLSYDDFALSYCIFICHDLLLFLEGLLFYIGKQKRSGSRGESSGGVTAGVWGGKIVQYILHERRIYFQ